MGWFSCIQWIMYLKNRKKAVTKAEVNQFNGSIVSFKASYTISAGFIQVKNGTFSTLAFRFVDYIFRHKSLLLTAYCQCLTVKISLVWPHYRHTLFAPLQQFLRTVAVLTKRERQPWLNRHMRLYMYKTKTNNLQIMKISLNPKPHLQNNAHHWF